MISTRNLLSSPTNHLSTLMSLSSSSSSLSSSSSSCNNPSVNSTTTPTSNIAHHQHTNIDLSDLANSLGLMQQQTSTIDYNNNNLNGYDLNLFNALLSANKIKSNPDTNMFSTFSNTELKNDSSDSGQAFQSPTQLNAHDFSIQRRNSSFQSPPQEEDDEEILNENFNLIRKRFNSVGSHVEISYGWPNHQNLNSQSGMLDNEIGNYNYRRNDNMLESNEFVQSNRRDQRAMSFNYSDLNNHTGYYFDNKNCTNSTDQSFMANYNLEKKDLLSRSLSTMTNLVENSLAPIGTFNHSQVFQNKQQQPHQLKVKSTLNCLNPNCNLLNENLEFVKFVCNYCQSINVMHTLCYKKVHQTKRNSFNSSVLPSENYNAEINYNCNNCFIGFLNLASNPNLTNNQNHNQQQYHQYQSSFKTKNMNNSNRSFSIMNIEKNNESNKFMSRTNIKLNKQHSSPAVPSQVGTTSSNSLRKKSLCLNNPPLPTPMQSVRESRSPSPIITTNSAMPNHLNGYKMTKRQSAPVNIGLSKNRFRTMSTGSTGSFSASSSFSSCTGNAFCVSPTAQNENNLKKILNNQKKTESPEKQVNNKSSSPKSSSILNESLGEKLASSGNMFYSRDDWSILTHVPFNKQNAIHIRLEDDGPYGNDETRCFLLSHFSKLGIREMACIVCACNLNIYDRFPLIDGTFYMSPVKYESSQTDQSEKITCSVQAEISSKNQFIYAVCLNCLHANKNQMKCKTCQQVWRGGSTLQIGTMYRYEIFAAFPCCQKRLNCSKCDTPIVNLNKTGGLQYFSSYSDEITCQVCKTKDYHFIKPLKSFYDFTSFNQVTMK